ncbi:hypothetical protein M0802_012321 [Mischocyttarus mexicanus]|nr:hypothetical protein M0802_012321 [Mischocyttarus mexicanus]
MSSSKSSKFMLNFFYVIAMCDITRRPDNTNIFKNRLNQLTIENIKTISIIKMIRHSVNKLKCIEIMRNNVIVMKFKGKIRRKYNGKFFYGV